MEKRMKEKEIGKRDKQDENKKKRWLLLLLLLLLFVIVVIGITYGVSKTFRKRIEDTFNKNKITAPEIMTTESGDWLKEGIITIKKDSSGKNKIDHYEYCVMDKKDTKECKWIPVEGNEVKITTSGKQYVAFRAVDEKGNTGKVSNIEEVLVDNDGPNIKEINIIDKVSGKVDIEIKAEDELSGIKTYYYKLDNGEYKEVKNKFTIENLVGGQEYTLTILVEDNLGNQKEVTQTFKKKSVAGGTSTKPTNKPTTPVNPTSNPAVKEDRTIPQINLNNLPTEFYEKEYYKLPSYYKFGLTGGKVECRINNKVVRDTRDLSAGKYLVVCTATGNNGRITRVHKDFEVKKNNIPPVNPVIRLSSEKWIGEEIVYINYPENAPTKEVKIVYSDDTTTGWIKYYEGIKIDRNNTTVYARCQGENGVWSETVEAKIENIDSINPTIEKVEITEITGNTITVKVKGTDLESGIIGYIYSLDNENYTDLLGEEYTFENLVEDQEYKVYVRAIDEVGNQSAISTETVTIKSIKAPVIEISEDINTWTESKTITITHEDKDVKLYYSVDGGENWVEYKEPVKVVQNGTVIAKAVEGNRAKYSEAIEITTIDDTEAEVKEIKLSPKTSKITVTVESEDLESGINSYYYSLDGKEYVEEKTNTHTFTNLVSEKEYTVYVKVKNNVGKITGAKTETTFTKKIGEISYSVEPGNETWSVEKTVTIDYPYEENTEYKKEYSIDGGATWEDYTGPVTITEKDTTIIGRVIDGPNTKTASSFQISKIDTTEPTISLDSLPETVYTSDDYSLPTSYTVDEEKSGGMAVCSVNGKEYSHVSELPEGTYTLSCTVTTGAGKKSTVEKEITTIRREVVTGNSILEIVSQEDIQSGHHLFRVKSGDKQEDYPVHLYVLDGNQEWTESQTFGDEGDVATADTDAKNMVIVKVKGDLTVGSGSTVTTYKNNYGGPKGFTLYVTGTLTNNGTITMTAHGAKAEGQDVYLLRNDDGSYETVPAVGGSGGARKPGTGPGNAGSNGIDRKTAGGGSGGGYTFNTSPGIGGAGGNGTSYSGGTGGGGAYRYGTGGDGSSKGGAGGNALGQWDNTEGAGGGAGNMGGTSTGGGSRGSDGTGGLLIIYGQSVLNNGSILSEGSTGAWGNLGAGGSSGGGSINIFHLNELVKGTVSAAGGPAVTGCKYDSNGGAGGTGSITYTKIELVKVTTTYTYPNLTPTKVEEGYYMVSAKYSSTFVEKLYSVDNGVTWETYTDSIKVKPGTIVEFKGKYKDGTESMVTSYETPLTDGISDKVLTVDNEEIETIEQGQTKIFTIASNLTGRKLKVYTEGTVATDAKIKFYDSNDQELKNVPIEDGMTLVEIPENGYKVVIESGNSELKVKEISLRGEGTKVSSPEIEMNTTEWSSEKEVSISYPSGYTNEYSLDYGTTWVEYKAPIKVTETNTVVFTRTKQDEKIVSTSSLTITKVDAVEPVITLEIPDRIIKGADYEVPSSYSVGVSGGNPVCKVNETVVTNIKELEKGTYNLVCTLENGTGKEVSVSKEITIVQSENDALEIEYTNPEYTECQNVSCALNELYSRVNGE